MKLIELSKQGKHKGKYYAQVSDEDFHFVNQWRWRAVKRKSTIYAQRTFRVLNKKVTVQMHRIILSLSDEKIIVDHKDFDGLNCQRNNIRIATRTQNVCNSRKDRGTSKYIGVSWNTREGKWLSKVKLNGKAYELGYFDNEEEAAKARDKKALELHGEFVNLNFPI